MRRRIIPLGLFLTFVCGASAIETISFTSVQHTITAEKNGQVVYVQSSGEALTYGDSDSQASWYAGTDFENHGDWFAMDTSADIYPDPGAAWNGQEYRVSSTISALFEPAGSECEVHTLLHDEWWGCRSYAEITNTTSGQRLFYADYFGGDRDGIYPLTVGDMYRVDLYSGVSLSGENWDYLFTSATLNLAVLPTPIVPAPPSLLLALSGIAALLWSNRRKPRRQ